MILYCSSGDLFKEKVYACWLFKKVSLTRKYHIHIPLTNLGHLGKYTDQEQPHNSRNTVKVMYQALSSSVRY